MKQFYKYILCYAVVALAIIFGCTKDVDVEDEFDFNLKVVSSSIEGYVYDLSAWTTTITPERTIRGQQFRWSYEILQGEGKFEIDQENNTIVLEEGQKIIIPNSADSPSVIYHQRYLPTAVGDHIVKITVENNNNISKSVTINYKVSYAPFTFLFVPNANVYLINTKGPITSTILKAGGENESFKFRYLLSGGEGKLFDGDTEIPHGEEYSFPHGIKNLHYRPSSLGTHNILATVKAADGSTVSRVVDLIVENVPFTLDATAATTSVNLNQNLGININLSEGQNNSGVTYEIMHSYEPGSGSGTLKNENGTVVSAGQYYPITPGTFPYSFNSSIAGPTTINFKVRDSNGQIKEDSITIDVSNVAFTFTAVPSQNNVNLNQLTNLNFNLVPTASAPSVTYTLNYNGTAGDGILTKIDGTVITPGTPIAITPGTFQYRYKPTSLGAHTLNFTAIDNYGEQRTATINLNSIHTPVTFNVSSVTQAYVNQTVPVNFVITPQSNNGITYQMNYILSGGTGILKNGNEEIVPGNFFDANTGSFTYQFKPTIAGNFQLTFELKDSNGQVVTRSITIVVQNNNFTFTPTQSQNVFVNENNSFSFALVPTGNYENITYQLSYTVASGQLGTFSQNGTQIQPGAPISVTPTSFNLTYRPTTIGQHEIHYFVTDSNGLHQEIVQTVNVIASDFNFTTQQSNATIYKNTPDNVVLSLSQTQINPNITYTLTYSITGVGQLQYNGSPLPNSSVITPGNKTLKFVSSELGSSSILFTLTDSNGTVHTRTVNYAVINTNFTLSTSGDGTLIINNIRDFNVYLSQVLTDPTTTYQVRYTIGSGSVGSGIVLRNGNPIEMGTFSDINVGSTPMSFKGSEPGLVNLIVEVKDNNNVSHTSTIVFNVAAITYTFTGAPQNTSIFLGGNTNLNFDISETSLSGTNYEMKYVITQGNAEIKNGSQPMNANEWFPVNIGAFSRSFIATETGVIKATFTVRNTTTLVERTQIISITVNQAAFNFNATATANNQTVNTPVNVNYNLVQTGAGNIEYTMVFNTSSQGTLTYNGVTYTAGQPIPFTVGSSFGSYKGSVPGTHTVSFTVTNSNNVAANASVSINYLNNDFNLSTSGDGSLILNNTKDLNVYLSQLVPDNSISYQVKYSLGSGTVGNGELKQSGSNVPMGSFMPIQLGNTALEFKGTGVGLVNLEVTVKDSNNVLHTAIIALNVTAVNYSFTGAPQNNTVFLGGDTNLNFDITETAPTGTNYEIKYVTTQGNAEIKNGSEVLNSNQWYPVNIGTFSRVFHSTEAGVIKATFTVRNTTTLVEKTQIITVTVGQSVFNFNATATANNQTVNTPVNVNFNLTQTGSGSNQYTMVFNTSGQGTFTYNGTTYTAGQPIPFTVGSSFGAYKGTTAGIHNVSFTVTNSNNLSHNAGVSITYTSNDFTLSTSGDGSLIVNNTKDLNVFLSQLSTDNSISYQVKYSLASGSVGNGELKQGNTPVPLGVFAPISLGNTALQFKGTMPGLVNLEVVVRDSNNLSHTATIVLNVSEIGYTFTGAPQNNSIYVGETTNLNFDISETAPSGTSYQMKYVITQGNAEIKNGSQPMNANEWYPVNVGAFSRILKSVENGSVKITFTVKNATTLVEKTQVISVNVNQATFGFNATATANNQTVNTPVNVNFNLTQTGVGAIQYSMVFNTSSQGTFTYNGTSYTAGQPIPISVGATFGNYKGSVAGIHNVTFTVTSSNNITQSSQIAITYLNNDFSLSTSGDGSIILNNTKDLNVFVSQLIPDNSISYQVRYAIASGSTGNGELSQAGQNLSLGVFHPITLGNTPLLFRGTTAGTVNLEVTVRDSNNVTHSATIALNVNAISYTFTGAPQNNAIYNGQNTNLNFDISETASSGTNFEMKYVFTQGNGEILNGNQLMNANQWYPVNVGAFSRVFHSTETGTIKATFTVRNTTTLVEKTQVISLNVNQPTFSFTATATATNQIVATPVPINFNLTQSGGNNGNYNMVFTTSGQGTFTYNGTTYTPGEVIPFTAGSSTGSYKGNVAGIHNVTFTVTNSTNVTQSAQVSITYLNNDFTLSASGSGSLNLNGLRDFNVFLAQNVNNPGITYQAKYTIETGSTGSGQVMNGGSSLTLGGYHNISPGATALTFKGTTAGTVNLKIEVKDSNNISHTANLSFQVQAIDFTLSTSGDGSLLINAHRPFTTFLSQSAPDNTITYQVKYSYAAGTTGTGEIYNGSTLIPLGNYIPTSLGSTALTFKGTTAGVVKLQVEVRDSNNIVHSNTIQFTVTQPDYTFSGSAQNSSLYVGGETSLNFDITEAIETGANYQMKYVITDGSGIIKSGGNTLSANQWYPVNIGGYSWNFTGNTNGDVSIVFTVRNTTTLVTKTTTININVSNSNFQFTAAAAINNQTVNTPIPVNFNLTQVGSGTVNYTLKFTSTLSGTFIYNGTTYSANQPIPFVLGSSTGTYIGTTNGTHNVTFTVTNSNTPPVSQSALVAINYSYPDFTLSTSGDGTVVQNDNRNFNVFLAQIASNPGITYQVKYTYASGTTGEGQVMNGSTPIPLGVYQPIDLGSTARIFHATALGQVKLLVEVKDSNNIVHSSTIVFNVTQIGFTYTATGQYATVFINSPMNINQHITESGVGGGTYEVRYVLTQSTGTAKITKSGIEVQQGVWTPVNSGSFAWGFEGLTAGTVNFTMYARNNSGVIQSQNVSVLVKNGTFTVEVTHPTSAYVTTNVPIDFTITEVGASSVPYSMTYSNSNTGTFRYNGVDYAPGSVISGITNLSFSGNYTSNVIGMHNLSFTILSAYNQSVVKNVSLNLMGGDFNYVADPTPTSGNVDEEKTTNHSISNISGPSTSFEYSYTINSGSGTMTRNGASQNQNTWYAVSNSFTTKFKPTFVGSTVVTYKVRNSFGVVKTFDVTYNATAITGNPQIVDSVKRYHDVGQQGPDVSCFLFTKFNINYNETPTNLVTNVKIYIGTELKYNGVKTACFRNSLFKMFQNRAMHSINFNTELYPLYKDLKVVVTYQQSGEVTLNVPVSQFVQDTWARDVCN